MKTSETTTKFWVAFLDAQRKIGGVEKRGTNSHFNKHAYAKIEDILAAIRLPLLDAGLLLCQYTDGEILKTRVTHAESGEYVEVEQVLIIAKRDAQGLGSAITYARRYSLVSLFALHDDESDDDGNAACGIVPPKEAATTFAKKKPAAVKEDPKEKPQEQPRYVLPEHLDEMLAVDELRNLYRHARNNGATVEQLGRIDKQSKIAKGEV